LAIDDIDDNLNEKLRLEELVAQRTEALEKELKQRKTVEEELKKSVSLLTATLESTADGILVVDKTGKIINYNGKFIEFWGIPESMIATCNDDELLSFVINQLKDPDGFQKKVRELYINDEESSFDILEFNDGRTIERYSQSQRIEGKCVGRVWSFRNITGRKQAEDDLLQSRKSFQNYFQNCSVGMSVTSPDKKWLEVNQSLCRMLGYSKEDLGEKNWIDLTYPEDIEKNQALFSDMTDGKLDQYDLDKRFIKKDGSLLYVTLSAVCERNPDGSVHHLLASYIDITERKLAEEALKASEALYRNLVEKLPDGVYKSTYDGKFISVNPAMVNMLGYDSREELMAIDIKNELYFEPEDRIRLLSETIEDEFDVYKLKRKDGSEIWVEDHSWFNTDEKGNILYHEGIIRDITDRKRVEDQLRSLSRAVDQNPVSIVITDTSGQIEYVNPKFSELTGYSPDEVIGRSPGILKSGVTTPAEYTELWETILSGAEWQGEFINKKKSGEEYFENALISPIKDENGKITHFLAVKEDITDRKRAEDALRKSEEKIRIHIQRTPIAVIEYDKEFHFLSWNPAAENIFGFNAEEAIGQHINLIVPESLGFQVVDIMQKVVEDGVALQHTNENITKSGEIITCEWYNSPLVAADGTVTGMAAFAIDITKRNRAEATIREMNSKLARAQQMASIGNWESNLSSGELNWSEEMYHIMRIPPDLPVNITEVDKVFPPEELERFWKAVNAAINEDIPYSMDYKIIRSDGSLQYIHDEGEISRDEHGTPILMFGTTQDITERKQVELALQESNELNRSLLQSIPFGMDIVDENGNILFQSENLEKLFGPKAIGQKCWSLYCDNQLECIECPLKAGINIGKTEISESQFIFGGKTFQINHTGMLFKGKKAILEIFQDITEMKKNRDELISAKETAEESNRLKSAFLATMNHELRTPLNHILGFSELIMSGVDPEDNVSFASSIQSSGQSLLSIIEGVFDLALVEQSNIKLRNQTFNLMDYFMENKASFDNILRTSTKHEQIHLIFKPDTRWLSGYVTADRSKINQVLTNLFKNAVKFTQKGTIEFGFKVENESYLMFYVKDTGIGIPMDKQCVIFDFFRQGDDSSTRVYGGIGIGLAISQKITKILNGELKVASEPGTGSTFSLTIPVELSDKQR